MTLAEFAARAVTVPFAPYGRDYSGWDCWGLLRAAYADVLGIALPAFDRFSPFDRRLVAAAMSEGGRAWREVTEIEAGDAVLMRVGNVACHVGLVLPQERVLHAQDGLGTLNEPLVSPHVQPRIVGFYRYHAC